jgi:hypothetical protein
MATTKQEEEKMSSYVLECFYCNREKSVEADAHDVEAWRTGELIQVAMPYLTAGERELFISGTCDNCWEKMFGEN